MADYTKRAIITEARKNEVCAETGKPIRKFAKCWFNVKTKRFYHIGTKAEDFFIKYPNYIFSNVDFTKMDINSFE